MTLWKVTVVARHRSRFAKSHTSEDALVSYLFTRTKREAARWAALETIVIVSRYDRGADFYWDDERSVEETEELKAPVRKRRKWRGWPAMKMGNVSYYPPGHPQAGGIIPIRRGEWYSTRTLERLTEKEARRRNRISLTRRRRRKAREEAEELVPIAPRLNVFYREFSPYETRDAFRRVEEPPGYEEREGDEDTIERLHGEYDELEAEGSPSGA